MKRVGPYDARQMADIGRKPPPGLGGRGRRTSRRKKKKKKKERTKDEEEEEPIHKTVETVNETDVRPSSSGR